MKRLLFMLAFMASIVSCDNYQYDDSAILDRLQKLESYEDMELRYDRPFCAAASPEYHSNFDEEKSQIR